MIASAEIYFRVVKGLCEQHREKQYTKGMTRFMGLYPWHAWGVKIFRYFLCDRRGGLSNIILLLWILAKIQIEALTQKHRKMKRFNGENITLSLATVLHRKLQTWKRTEKCIAQMNMPLSSWRLISWKSCIFITIQEKICCFHITVSEVCDRLSDTLESWIFSLLK